MSGVCRNCRQGRHGNCDPQFAFGIRVNCECPDERCEKFIGDRVDDAGEDPGDWGDQ